MNLSRQIHYLLKNILESIFDRIALLLSFVSLFLKPIAAILFNSIGVEIDGNNACDIKVNDNIFYGLMAAKGLTGFFDAYIEGYIESNNLEELFMKIQIAPPLLYHIERYHPYRLLNYFIHTNFDVLTPESIKNTTKDHYEDYANYIKESFDSTAHYSTTLLYDLKEVEEANIEKINELLEEGTFRTREQIARKLKLEPGMKVLDIGCGFGGLAKHLAERYKVEVTGVTICEAMAEHAAKVCKGLPVKIIYNDYRAVTGKFDRIVSIEMFEHVGKTHHREYFEKVNSLLTDDGIFVFQAHHINHDYLMSYTPMFEKSLQMYIYFPRLEEIAKQSKGLLLMEDIENLGYCFGVSSKAVLKKMVARKAYYVENLSEKAYKIFHIYGCLSVAGGLSGRDRVYQIVFSKNNLSYHYHD